MPQQDDDSAIQTNIEVINIDVDKIEASEQEDNSQEVDPVQALAANDDLKDELYGLFLDESKQHIQTIEELVEAKKRA